MLGVCIYLSLHCQHQNDSCIKMGSVVSHFNVSVIVEVGEGGDYIPIATLSPPERLMHAKMGSDVSHFNVSLIVRDKVTRLTADHNFLKRKGEPKRIRTEVPLLTSLTPYR